MIDIAWDFSSNDISFQNGDIVLQEPSGTQNAALIFTKQAASITNAAVGIGFEDFYPNLPQWDWGNVTAAGEKQIMADGATFVHIEIFANDNGVTSGVNIEAKYNE